jgi:hypothetical protein
MKKLTFLMGFLLFLSPVSTCFSATHSVKLDWVASTTPGVTYDVFRGNAPGAESITPIASGIAALTLIDSSAGDSSCWVVKAKLVQGANTLYSGPSNEVCLTYPSAPGTLTATPQ